jgi:hypothetical protein
VVADALTRRGSGKSDLVGALDGFGAVEHFHGQTDRPDLDVGGAKAQPVIVAIDAYAISSLLGFGQVRIRASAIT